MPGREDLPARLSAVLRVVYLVFTEGHLATGGAALIRGDLCDQAIRLARALAALPPGEPEVTGLLAPAAAHRRAPGCPPQSRW